MIYQIGLILVLIGCVGHLFIALGLFTKHNSREDGRIWRNEALQDAGFYDLDSTDESKSHNQENIEIIMDAQLRYHDLHEHSSRNKNAKVFSHCLIVLGVLLVIVNSFS